MYSTLQCTSCCAVPDTKDTRYTKGTKDANDTKDAMNSLNPKMVLLQCNYITQCLDLLTGLIPSGDDKSATPPHLVNLYLFSLMWSLGACLELDDRSRLQEFLQGHESKPTLPKMNGAVN